MLNSRTLACLLFIGNLFWIMACQSDPPILVHQMAQQPNLPLGAPKYSDVCFSSRTAHPRNAEDTLNTFEVARAFHVDHFQWVYTADSTFIKRVVDSGYTLQTTLSPTMSDLPIGSRTRTQGRILNPKGEKVTAPWMQSWEAWWGCVNHPDFQEIYWAYMQLALDAGVRSFQVDDPGLGEQLRRNEYAEVCYCPHCQAKADRLGETVEAIQAASVMEFHESMRQKASDYVEEPVVFSCNNFRGVWDLFPFNFFDFGIAEMPMRRGNPEYVYNMIRETHRLGKGQVYSYVANRDWLIKMMIGSTYASGGNLLVPWDVWQGTGNPRFYGKPEDYAPHYAFIKANAEWLEEYEDAFYTNTQLDPRYLNLETMPVHFQDYRRSIHAYVRAKPNNMDAAVVLHLVDWEVLVEDFEMVLNEDFFFQKGIQNIELLTPVAYDRAAHQIAFESKDYTQMSKSIALDFEYEKPLVRIKIPALEFFWGILIIR